MTIALGVAFAGVLAACASDEPAKKAPSNPGFGARLRPIAGSAITGLVTFQPEDDAEAVAARLLEEGVVVRNIPGTPFVRASCGWWTNEDDVERLVRELSAA